MKGGRAGVVTDALLKVNSASVTLSVAARWIARRHLLVVGLLPRLEVGGWRFRRA